MLALILDRELVSGGRHEFLSSRELRWFTLPRTYKKYRDLFYC